MIEGGGEECAAGIYGAGVALWKAVGARISQKIAVGVVFVAAMFMSIMDSTSTAVNTTASVLGPSS